MEEKLEQIKRRFEELERLLADPEVTGSPRRLKEIGREHAGLKDIVEAYERYREVSSQLADAKELQRSEDPELAELAGEEVEKLEGELEELRDKLKIMLTPKDPLDRKNAILEIRAGAGGEEAALFAREIFDMYRQYADSMKWRTEVLSSHPTGQGGFKEIIAQVSGEEVYGRLRFESGVHRVQRVPVTESQGRIHTSAVTVAVLPEADEMDFDIDENDLKTDVFRAGGPGGQHVNTTDSAVRITHKPTGLTVVCQDERSQHKNKAKAMKILRSRLLDLEEKKRRQERASLRKSMVGSGDRSEKIRTYNFPQGRITDHRVGLTLHKLDRVLAGDINEFIDALSQHFRQPEAMEKKDDRAAS